MRAFLIALPVAMPTAAIAQTDPGLQQCAVMPSPAARLNCYDALARTRAQQPPAIGTMQICRTPGVQGLHQEDSIEIPEGATMVNFGEKSPSVSVSLGIVILATTAASVLMHGKPCVKVAAKVKEKPETAANCGRATISSTRRLWRPPRAMGHHRGLPDHGR